MMISHRTAYVGGKPSKAPYDPSQCPVAGRHTLEVADKIIALREGIPVYTRV